MATLAQARERIYKAWTDAAVLPTAQFCFDNETFTPPTNLPWARIAVRHRLRGQETLGAVGLRKFESAGGIFVQCFVPLDKGLAAVDNLASLARAVFEGKVLLPEHIRCYGAAIREIGPDEAWYQVNVEASFTYDETK